MCHPHAAFLSNTICAEGRTNADIAHAWENNPLNFVFSVYVDVSQYSERWGHKSNISHANIEQRATKLLPHRTYWVMRKRWKWQECLQLCWELQYSLKDTRGRINSYGAETGLHPLNLWPVNFKSELRGWCALEKSCEEFKEQIWECQLVNRGAGQTCHVHTLRS